MAKFTSQEVSALQGGGNASAKEIYFKEWDPQRQSFPDSSNVQRLREFIKHVYVDKRYTDERSFNKSPKVKLGEAEDSYRGGSRSPPFRPSPGGSPPTARSTDTVNDRKLEDRLKVEFQSPDHQKDPDIASPSIVRPVREILGDKVSLRVIEPPKVNVPRLSDGSLRTQITVSSNSLASSNGNPAEHKTESSLIDFDAVPESPSTTQQVPQIQHTAPSVTQPTTSNNNWANFDSVQEVKVSKVPSNTNLLDILSELSVGAPISHSTVAPGGAQATTPGPNAFVNTTDGGQWQNQAPLRSFNSAVGGSQNNQPWNPSLSGNAEMLSNSHGAQSQVTQGVEVKPTAQKELPVGLFSSNYSSFAAPGPGWFPAPQYGMGYVTQYNVPMSMPPYYMQPSTPSNPFDVNNSSAVRANTFPSMAPLQGALPNTVPQPNIHRTSSLGTWMPTQSYNPLPPSNIQRTSSLGTPSSPWMSSQSSHPLSMSPQVPSYGSAVPSGPFMGQVAPSMQPSSRPQASSFGVNNTSFGTFNYNQQQSGSSFSSTRGNPFG